MGARYLDNLDQIEVFTYKGLPQIVVRGVTRHLVMSVYSQSSGPAHTASGPRYIQHSHWSRLQSITVLKYFHGLARPSADAINNKEPVEG